MTLNYCQRIWHLVIWTSKKQQADIKDLPYLSTNQICLENVTILLLPDSLHHHPGHLHHVLYCYCQVILRNNKSSHSSNLGLSYLYISTFVVGCVWSNWRRIIKMKYVKEINRACPVINKCLYFELILFRLDFSKILISCSVLSIWSNWIRNVSNFGGGCKGNEQNLSSYQ